MVLCEPQDEGAVLYFDEPWEGPFCGYSTIIHDGSVYRLYYRGLPTAGKDGSAIETTCYAESKNGINWSKPNLELFDVLESNQNNVILAGDPPFSHNFSPFLDTKPGIPAEEKFKAVAGTKKTGLYGFKSPDGIHWKKIQDGPVFQDGIFDSQNVVFWSEQEKQYVCYFRSWTKTGYSGIRTVSRTTSSDFINWTDPIKMNFGDTPPEHLYTNQTHPYFRAPQIYIAIAARFMPNRQVLTDEQAHQLNVNPKYFKDCSDVVMLTSRGENRYDRTFMESFIRPGLGLQNWVSRSNYPTLNVVQTAESEMSIYVNQNYAQPTAHLRRYSLRLDGFSSIKAPYSGGEMITRFFAFQGDQLVINYATSAAGEIKVEVQDQTGNPIAGYAENDSQEIIGNEVARVVAWKNGSSVKELAGKIIRLRFIMKDADLFSIHFE